MECKFSEEVSKLCYIAPYLFALNSYGYHLKEDYLFGITKGIVFKFCYIHNFMQVDAPLTSTDWISIEGSRTNVSGLISRHFGVSFHEQLILDRKSILEICKNELKANKYVTAFLDVYYLKYHPQYRKVHAQTNVVLCDWIDTEGGCFYFYDGHVTTIPASSYRGKLNENDFLKALIIKSDQIAFNGREVGILLNSRINNGTDIDVAEQIKENAGQMLFPSAERCGISGINHLSRDVEEWLLHWDQDSIKAVLKQGYHHITGRGGLTVSREVYADFLRNHADNFNIRNRVSKGFVESSREWAALGAKFFRGSLSFKEGVLNQLSAKLKEIAELEKDLFQELYDI